MRICLNVCESRRFYLIWTLEAFVCWWSKESPRCCGPLHHDALWGRNHPGGNMQIDSEQIIRFRTTAKSGEVWKRPELNFMTQSKKPPCRAPGDYWWVSSVSMFMWRIFSAGSTSCRENVIVEGGRDLPDKCSGLKKSGPRRVFLKCQPHLFKYNVCWFFTLMRETSRR